MWLAVSSLRDESFHLVVMCAIVASAAPVPDGLRIVGWALVSLQALRVVLATSADSDPLADDRGRLQLRPANKPQ